MVGNIVVCILTAWHAEAVPGATIYVSLGVDREGKASVVYWDDENIYYSQRFQSDTISYWVEEYVNNAWDPNYIFHDNYCVDDSNRPHLLFFRPPSAEDTPERYVYYVTKDSTGLWDCTYICNEFLYLEMIDLALDTMDYPHIIVHKMYHYWNGTSWEAETLDITPEYVLPSIVVDINNTVHLSIGGFPGNTFAGYGYNDGTGWYFEYDPAYPVTSPIHIKTDDSGNPHILLTLSTDSSHYYGTRENGVWTYEEITSLNPRFLDIHQNAVHILATHGSVTRHYWKEGSSWIYEDVHTGVPEDFVVDEDGNIHCLVYENGQIKYVTNKSQTDVREEMSGIFSGECLLSYIVHLPLRSSLAELGYPDMIEIVDISGRRVTSIRSYNQNGMFEWDGKDGSTHVPGNGIYFMILRKGTVQRIIKLVTVD
jgi:hypothetical protein